MFHCGTRHLIRLTGSRPGSCGVLIRERNLPRFVSVVQFLTLRFDVNLLLLGYKPGLDQLFNNVEFFIFLFFLNPRRKTKITICSATMREIHTQLYPNEQVGIAVGNYAQDHSTNLDSKIAKFHDWGTKTQEKSFFMISPLQAQFHIWLAKALGVKRSK